MKIVTVGLDIAKQTFQAHGVDCKGKVVLRKRMRRAEVSSFIAEVEPCLIRMEASGGAQTPAPCPRFPSPLQPEMGQLKLVVFLPEPFQGADHAQDRRPQR